SLGGSTANQSVSLNADGSGVVQTRPAVSGSFNSAVTVAANRGEAALFNSTLASLSDGLPTTLNNVTTIGPANNVTYALEWDFTINPNASKPVSIITQVPEPSVFVLGLMGVAGFLHFRRARRH